ncbi:hypothetical protein CXP35_10255 [Komagataeibacter xylinus]|nr:hypothetical protein CXP35_10255 [Komagataeibacter xylinus]
MTCNQEKVFGEAFFKKLRKNATFLKKGGTQKLLIFKQPLIAASARAHAGPVGAFRHGCAPCTDR